MHDLFNLVNPKAGFPPQAAITDNTAAASAWIDRQGYGSVTWLIITGTDADADATFAVTLQDADASDQSDAAAVADGPALLGTLENASYTFANDGQCFKLGYVGNKRYTKLTVTPANNTGNAFLGVICLLGHPDNAATPNPPN
jgi:hypothetical protein